MLCFSTMVSQSTLKLTFPLLWSKTVSSTSGMPFESNETISPNSEFSTCDQLFRLRESDPRKGNCKQDDRVNALNFQNCCVKQPNKSQVFDLTEALDGLVACDVMTREQWRMTDDQARDVAETDDQQNQQVALLEKRGQVVEPFELNLPAQL